MKPFFTFLFIFSCFSLSAQTKDVSIGSSANDRLAIVIGNNNYKHIDILTTPENDADAIGQVLKKLNFDVIYYKNTDYAMLDGAVSDMAKIVGEKKYKTVLIFYSGHGLQVKGVNYLIPIDANPVTPEDVKYKCTQADRFLSNLAALDVPTKIMLLDACRNNPFKSMVKSVDNSGLGFMSASGTFIGYAAAPGTKAADGVMLGMPLSPYTQAIINHIETPNISIDELFTRVSNNTQSLCQKANYNQEPFKNSSLRRNFYFKNAPRATNTPVRKAKAEPYSAEEIKDLYDRAIKFYDAEDYDTAFELFEIAALRSHDRSQFKLGWMYRKGYSVSQNDVVAVQWYRKAADQGHAAAQTNLGYMYENGYGVTENDETAVRWFRKAAEQGFAYGQKNLGNMYENGKGVAKNKTEAIRLYKLAAKQGLTSAQKELTRLGETW